MLYIYFSFSTLQFPNTHLSRPFLSLDRLWKPISEHRGWKDLLHPVCHIWHPALWFLVSRHWRPAGDHLCEEYLEGRENLQGELPALACIVIAVNVNVKGIKRGLEPYLLKTASYL